MSVHGCLVVDYLELNGCLVGVHGGLVGGYGGLVGVQ